MCRQRGEFNGRAWVTYCCDRDIVLHFSDARAPSQQWHTERVGGLLKDQFAKAWEVLGDPPPPKVDLLLSGAVGARDCYDGRPGFSAQSWVVGRNHRMPTNLLSDDAIDRQLFGGAHSDAMERSCAIRSATQRALFRQGDACVVRRAWAG